MFSATQGAPKTRIGKYRACPAYSKVETPILRPYFPAARAQGRPDEALTEVLRLLRDFGVDDLPVSLLSTKHYAPISERLRESERGCG